MNYLIGIIIPVFAFILESYPRWKNRLFGVDIWTHLLYLKAYKKQGGIPKKIDEGFLVPGEYDYPPAFITILSKFPINIVEKYEFLFSPFFDVIHIFIIFLLCMMITQNVYFSIIVQLFYILTPIIVIENSSATPRSLGYTLFTLYVFGFLGSICFHNPWYVLISVFVGPFIFLTHRFTTQGLLFFSIFFSLYHLSFMYLFIFLWSFIMAIILSKGFYLKVLRGHIGNLRFWKKVITNRFAHQVRGNISPLKTTDFVFRIYTQFLQFPPFVLTITNPWIIATFLFVVLSLLPSGIQLNSVLSYMMIWVIWSYICSVLTMWVPSLRFLGEGQRYLELSAFPASYLATTLLFLSIHLGASWITVPIYFLVSIGAIITIVVIQQKAIVKDTLRTLTPHMENMFEYLSNLKKKPKLLCIPHQITTNTIYHTGCEVFVNADYTTIEKIMDVYPYLKLPIDQIMKKYRLDMILLNEAYAKIEELHVANIRIVKRSGSFVLLKMN